MAANRLPSLGLSPKTELAMEWFLLNPEGSLAECARALGLKRGWLAQVVASDSFQGRYAERCRQAGSEGILLLAQKEQALQMLALDRGIELLEEGKASERFVGEIVKTRMAPGGANGGQGPGRVEQHLHLHVSGEDLRQARALAASVRATLPPPPRKLEEAAALGAAVVGAAPAAAGAALVAPEEEEG